MRAAGVEADRARRAANKSAERTHKGWRVVGIPPGLHQKAQAEHASVIESARKAGLPGDKPFDKPEWLPKQRRQAVRSSSSMRRARHKRRLPELHANAATTARSKVSKRASLK